MLQYKVRSGQNIYDIALTLYGSVEGIFDLLASNKWLNMETTLSYGMVLNYHENFTVNNNIAIWLNNNNILVKNGEHIHKHLDVESLIKQHIQSAHFDQYLLLSNMSSDEQNIYWTSLCQPKMIIHQHEQISTIIVSLKQDTHLIVDWGDYSDPQIIEGEEEKELEHCYKGDGTHIITFYGDFEFLKLDFRELNGIYYPLGVIYADEFYSEVKIDSLNKLIITQ